MTTRTESKSVGTNMLKHNLAFLLAAIQYGCANNLYKRIEARPAHWHNFAFAKVPNLQTPIECGGVCSSDALSKCTGFVFRPNERECILLELQSNTPTYTLLGGPQIESRVYYTGREFITKI